MNQVACFAGCGSDSADTLCCLSSVTSNVLTAVVQIRVNDGVLSTSLQQALSSVARVLLREPLCLTSGTHRRLLQVTDTSDSYVNLTLVVSPPSYIASVLLAAEL